VVRLDLARGSEELLLQVAQLRVVDERAVREELLVPASSATGSVTASRRRRVAPSIGSTSNLSPGRATS
jgi:hypothetical protein